jgi:hypothetical protein
VLNQTQKSLETQCDSPSLLKTRADAGVIVHVIPLFPGVSSEPDLDLS